MLNRAVVLNKTLQTKALTRQQLTWHSKLSTLPNLGSISFNLFKHIVLLKSHFYSKMFGVGLQWTDILSRAEYQISHRELINISFKFRKQTKFHEKISTDSPKGRPKARKNAVYTSVHIWDIHTHLAHSDASRSQVLRCKEYYWRRRC